MQNIFVSRYNPELQSKAKWAGTIEPEDRSWIVFIDTDNVPHLYLHRGISTAEAEERGFTPYDPATCRGIRGEYVESRNFPEGEKLTPNHPSTPPV